MVPKKEGSAFLFSRIVNVMDFNVASSKLDITHDELVEPVEKMRRLFVGAVQKLLL